MTATEHKAFALKLDGPPDDQGRFAGYAAVFSNVDLGNDVIEPGAFTKTLQETPSVTILWAHDTDEPIGIATSMVEDKRGLRVEGQLALEVQRAREVFSLMKLGAVKGLSIGYNVVNRYFKGQIRHLQELKLGEFSLCVFPMNPEANVDSLKAATRILAHGKDAATVDSTMWMINAGSDFMATLVQGGRYDIAQAVQVLIETLARDLFSGAEAGDPQDDDAIEHIKSLMSGRAEPGGLDEDAASMDALRDLIAGMRA